MDHDLKTIEENTQNVYEEYALQYDEERGRSLIEKSYLDKFIKRLSPNGYILDLGCGAGEPIARYIIENGFQVMGVDYSEPMLNICRQRFPGETWEFLDMRNYRLEGPFSGIVSWGAFFHLNKKEQRKNLPMICHSIEKKGVLLLTVGHEEGEVTGEVAGQKVFHSSLSQKEYEDILEQCDVEIIEFNLQDPQCHGFSVILGQKK